MAWSFNVLGASSVTTATTSLSFNVVDGTGATVSGVQVNLIGTGLTYDASTGTVAGTITSAELYDTVGSAAIQTLTLDTAHQTTAAADLSMFLSHALTFQTQLTSWGVDLATFKSFGTPVDNSANVIDPSTSPASPYGAGSVLLIPVKDGTGTIVNYLQIIGSQVDANKPGMNEYVQTVELLKADGTSYADVGPPVIAAKIADYTGPEYSAAGTEMLVSQIGYGAHGDWGTLFGVLASGNDTYVVNSASGFTVDAGLGNDQITGSAGVDTLDFTYATGGVKVDMTHKNASNVSDPTAEFTDPVLGTKFTQHFSGIEHVTGSLYSDNITGDSGNNYLFGGYDLAQDTLGGGAGVDTLTGGAGDDTYKIIDHLDKISEIGGGTDLIEAYVSYDITTLTGIENLTLYGAATDATGNSLANVIRGNANANVIDGAGGADTMIGNFGDDTYKVDNSADVVTEGSGLGSGIDTVIVTGVSYALTYGGQVEILKTNSDTGGTDLNLTGDSVVNTITGNSGKNILDGGASGADGQVDSLNGLLGNDTYVLGSDSDTVVDTGGTDTITSSITRSLADYTGADAAHAIENLTLTGTGDVNATGNQYDNELKGNSGANIFTGAAGNDTMTGGAGDDTFVWEANGKDVITDFRATYFTAALNAAGVVGSPASTSTATGTATVVMNLAGNQADIDLTTAGIDWLTANTGSTAVRGVAVYTGATTANGASSHDVLNDGTNKTILVANQNIKDNWKAISAGDKTNLLADGTYLRVDTVGSNSAGSNGAIRGQITKDAGTFADVIDVSGLHISEFATIQAIATASGTSDTVLTRNLNNVVHQLLLENVAKADLLAGHFTFDTATSNRSVAGTAYADDLFGGKGDDTISGGAGVDRLFGEAGADYINGGTGNDLMYGGAGNDTFVVDSTSDKIFDASGSDTIISSVTFTLATTALAGVEDLQASGTGNINLVGNAQTNTITGNSGNNLIDGKGGADDLAGAGGNDSYYVDNANDLVTETTGTDVVAAAVSYVLRTGVSVEKLMTYNNTIQVVNGANVLVPIDMNLTGNELAQAVIGNGKINVINGGAGNDTLTGGAGKDTFVFNTALNATTNKDTITDFSPVDDTIKLENTGAGLFNALGTGTLAATRFYTGTAAHDSDDRIIYNKTTGVLSYDADGTGATAAVAFAVIANKTALTNLDFVVI